MKILLSNDDGIRAPGIVALHRALADPDGRLGGPIADVVWPVAPLTVQSATSHGITYKTPLMVSAERIDETMSGVAVDGRPADCTKLAVSALWPERFGEGTRPDLVISGMNAGANCGINVIYSGTVAAALEAAFLGVPAIAVSLHLGRGRPRFDVAAAHARKVIERVLATGFAAAGSFPSHECLNINIPRTEDIEGGPEPDPDRLPPVRVCPMNTHAIIDAYDRRESPQGDVYYWPASGGLDFHDADEGGDVDRLFAREITVTPLLYDLTRRDSMDRWRERLEG